MNISGNKLGVARTATGGVHRQGQSVSNRAQGSASPPSARATEQQPTEIGSGARGTRYRVGWRSTRRRPKGGWNGGTLLRHRARPAGERPAPSASQQPRASQSLSRPSVSALMEPALHLRRVTSRRCASWSATEFDIQPGGSADRGAGLHRALGPGRRIRSGEPISAAGCVASKWRSSSTWITRCGCAGSNSVSS
jgi:hypothetical protein